MAGRAPFCEVPPAAMSSNCGEPLRAQGYQARLGNLCVAGVYRIGYGNKALGLGNPQPSSYVAQSIWGRFRD